MPDAALRPFSIKLFVPDGDPDGQRQVEKSNWTGIALGRTANGRVEWKTAQGKTLKDIQADAAGTGT